METAMLKEMDLRLKIPMVVMELRVKIPMVVMDQIIIMGQEMKTFLTSMLKLCLLQQLQLQLLHNLKKTVLIQICQNAV